MKIIKKYCIKDGAKLVPDGFHTYFDGETGKKIEAYNLICPNYQQPHTYQENYDGIDACGHSNWVWNDETNELEVDDLLSVGGVINPNDFPSFIKVSKQPFWNKLLSGGGTLLD